MTLELSHSYEAHNNRKERKVLDTDIVSYTSLVNEINDASDVAYATIRETHPEVIDLLERLHKGEDVADEFDASEEIGKLQKKDKELYALIMKVELKDMLATIVGQIKEYVHTVHQQTHTTKSNEGIIDVETKNKIESIDKDRSRAHDALIQSIQALARSAKTAGVDSATLNMLLFDAEKENTVSYRARIQHWAEHVADYLALISETTLKNGGGK